MSREPAVVALGGGHGLAATLAALAPLTTDLTAIVTVADDGGSSGRLRQDFDVLPPGDLRMALAALTGETQTEQLWREVLQHRFDAPGELGGHCAGNLVILALWQVVGDVIGGLELAGRLVGARGKVLPMSMVPLGVEADISRGQGEGLWHGTVRGQRRVAVSGGRVEAIRLVPPDPPACPEAVEALRRADWIVLGPGSWYTSVIPHLLVPQLAKALGEAQAGRIVTLNLAPQRGETTGYTAADHLAALRAYAPGIGFDAVIVDPSAVGEPAGLEALARDMGARVLVRPVRRADGSAAHDPGALAKAYAEVLGGDPDGGRPALREGELPR